MKPVTGLIAAIVLVGASAVPIMTQASAQTNDAPGKVCLRNNEIYSWNAPDDRTLVVTDVHHDRYLVHLSGGCIGLNSPRMALAFHTTTSLGCLGPGDSVSFHEQALGRMSCAVNSVERYREPIEHKRSDTAGH